MNQREHERFEQLLSRLFDGSLSGEDRHQLDQWLRTDLQARALYHDHITLHALLRWKESEPLEPETPLGTLPSNLAASDARDSRRRRWHRVLAAMAATLLVGLAIWQFLRVEQTVPGTAAVAVEILESQNVTPAVGQSGQTRALSRLDIESGVLRLRIKESGVVLNIAGPTEMNLVSLMVAQLSHGQVTADVAEQRGKGFRIKTAHGQFVDLGTTFGIDANQRDSTAAVVFRGSVEVYPDAGGATPLSKLYEGEAARIGPDESLTRILNIVTGTSPEQWSTSPPSSERCIIASVRDNFRDPRDRVFYEIVPGGLNENTQAYVGPRHVWKGRTAAGLPPYLLGADLVRTFPIDQDRKEFEIKVRLSRPAVLYVLFECRPQQQLWREAGNVDLAPRWLQNGFQKTGDAVGLDDAGQLAPGETMSLKPGEGHLVTFDVWKREVREPGDVTLGPPTGPDAWKNWMYAVAAKPLEAP